MEYLLSLRDKVGHQTLINTGGRIIIENDNHEVLLIKRKDFGVWGLPGGGLEIGESIQECIRREVREETGLEILEMHLVGISSDPELESIVYPNGDQVQNMSLVLFSSQWEGNLLRSSEESSCMRFFSVNTLPRMLQNEKHSLERYLAVYKKSGRPFID